MTAPTLLLLAACSSSPETPDSPTDSPTTDTQDSAPGETGDADTRGNVLVVIADDMGLDASPCYGLAENPVTMPNLEALCSRGVRMERAWATPSCSPTRASLLTGTSPAVHGVTRASRDGDPALPSDSVTLPELASEAGIATASFGKWHLGDAREADGAAPNSFGWDHYSGLLDGAVASYWSWEKTTDGLSSIEEGYVTTVLVDEAITWVDQQDAPWLLWMAFNAPHSPYHVPPAELHSYDALGAEGDCLVDAPRDCYEASLEALDTELGRLLTHLEDAGQLDDTLVIFIGDNGTPRAVTEGPIERRRAKGAIYEGGIRVPMVVAGPGVAEGQVSESITDLSDLLPTLMAWWGLDSAGAGDSLLPHWADPTGTPHTRQYTFSGYIEEPAEDENGWTVSSQSHKLIQFSDGSEALYNLEDDPWEETDLLPGASEETTQLYELLLEELESRKP